MKILTVYDGTLNAKKALLYGIVKARSEGGELILLHVFDPDLFIDYDAGPKAEELARAESRRYVEEARKIIAEKGEGLPVRMISVEGDAVRTIRLQVEEEHADLLLLTERYKGVVRNVDCPITMIPGTILVPVDNTGNALANLERINEEVKATGSRVLVLGIVPVHLYSREEKKELERVRKSTDAVVNSLKRALAMKGIEAVSSVVAGYPDEEILKAAEASVASLIILPSGGATPSELTKAAAILLDEPKQLRWAISLLPA